MSAWSLDSVVQYSEIILIDHMLNILASATVFADLHA